MSGDLDESRIPNDLRVRRELALRWAARLLGHASTSLRRFGHEADATALQTLANATVDDAWVRSVLERCHQLRPQLRADPLAGLFERPAGALDTVIEAAHQMAYAIGGELGTITTVIAARKDENEPWTPVEQEEAEQIENSADRVISIGAEARTVARVVGGESGYIAEVVQQYAELYPDGHVNEYQPNWNGHRGRYLGRGSLIAGMRFRVFSAFTDLDGVRHPWGESWQFDGCTFSPTTCEVRLLVSNGVQLDPKGRPGPAIPVAPFRIGVDIDDRPGSAGALIRSCIDTDLTEWGKNR